MGQRDSGTMVRRVDGEPSRVNEAARDMKVSCHPTKVEGKGCRIYPDFPSRTSSPASQFDTPSAKSEATTLIVPGSTSSSRFQLHLQLELKI